MIVLYLITIQVKKMKEIMKKMQKFLKKFGLSPNNPFEAQGFSCHKRSCYQKVVSG